MRAAVWRSFAAEGYPCSAAGVFFQFVYVMPKYKQRLLLATYR